VAEFVREAHPEVNQLVSNMKKVLKNSIKRRNQYYAETQLSLPPNPVIVRWCTFIDTGVFYSENFLKIKKFVNSLKSVKIKAIRDLREQFKKNNLAKELHSLAKYSFISSSVTKLQTQGLDIKSQLEIVEQVRS